MDVFFLMIIVSILFSSFFIIIFFLNVKYGQFDINYELNAIRILMDDDNVIDDNLR
jgi:cbb3-type cytochrome oxidase maturation protein